MVNIKKIEDDIGKIGHITNCYLVYGQNRDGILIDAGYDYNKILGEVEKNRVNVKYIVITHGHADHIGAVEKIQKYLKCKVIVHEMDYKKLISLEENYSDMFDIKKQELKDEYIMKIKSGYTLDVGDLKLEFIHTPGHTSGSICIYEKEENILFTGDTIFEDCYGRCDLYSASIDEMASSVNKLFSRFSNITIYPGHGNSCNIEKSKKYIKMLLGFKGYKI